MKRKFWIRLVIAGAAISALCIGTWQCVQHAILDHFTDTTTRTLATSFSGRNSVLEEAVNHGALRSYRYLRLEASGADPVPIASSDWAFEFAAKWLDESHVEITARRLGAADTVSCRARPFVLGKTEIAVVFRSIDGTKFMKQGGDSAK